MKNVTIYDIANELKISPTTVSRCFDQPSLSNVKTREKVMKVAKSLGYFQNPFAKSLRNKKAKDKSIVIIVPIINDRSIIGIISGIEKSATASGYNTFICQSFGDSKEEIRLMQLYFRNNISGLFIWSDNYKALEKCSKSFIQKNIPIISINYTNTGAYNYIKKVPIDYQRTLKHAVTNLFKQGSTKITFFFNSQEKDLLINAERFIESNKELELKLDTFDSPIDMTSKIIDLSLNENNHGIIFSNSKDAINFKKKREYKNISILAFNHDPLIPILEPTLSIINMNGEKYGICATKIFLAHRTTDIPFNSYEYDFVYSRSFK